MSRKYKCSIPNCLYNNRYSEENDIHCPFNNKLNVECKNTWLYDSLVHETSLDSYYDFCELKWTEINYHD